MNVKTIIFHGPSGSGKDTQIDLLKEVYPHERIGFSMIMNVLREEGHPRAISAYENAKVGKLSTDEDVYVILKEWLPRLNPDLPWFFVSPVRKATQIGLFDDLALAFGRKLDLFVHFTLSEEAAIERMSLRYTCPTCGETYHKKYKPEKADGICDNDGGLLFHREDDQPDAIAKRLKWYEDDLAPILNEYKAREVLLEIDASPTIDQIQTTLRSALSNYEI